MLRQQRADSVSEDRLRRCQSYGKSEHQGKFKGKGFVDAKKGDHVTSKVRRKDELIKYMKNPPGYLQKMERVENFQGKALSFGVLDWKRLENWKHAAEGTYGADGTDVPSSGLISSSEDTAIESLSRSSSVSMNSYCYGDEKYSQCWSSASAYHKGTCFRECVSVSQVKVGEKKWEQRNTDSFDEDYSELLPIGFRKRLVGQRVGNFSSNMRNHRVSLGLRENFSVMGADTKKRMEERKNSDINRKMLDRTSTLSSSSVNSSEDDIIITPGVQHKTSFRTDERKTHRMQELDLSRQHQCSKPKNIVLLRPSKHAQNGHVEEDRLSVDTNLVEKEQNNFSAEFCCEKTHSHELSSRIPHSCPLTLRHQTDPRPEMSSELLCETLKALECKDNQRDTRDNCSIPRNVECRTQCVLDEEMHKETSSSKGRHPSPNPRFSFSFSQMGRSFSFKESSSLPASSSPPHVSVKSGPLTSNTSACAHRAIQVKQKGHNRTRSSPLRRILDPLLKSKSENLVPSKGVCTSSNASPSVNKSPENVNKDASTFRALLQFTIRNGVHLFQFVIDEDSNDNSVLAATMKKPDSSTQLYTFFSIKEVKKKSGSWLGQANKQKNQGFGHTTVGHMRLHTSFNSDLAIQRLESVIIAAGTNQCDQSMPSRELAAIVDEMRCAISPSECHSHEVKRESRKTTVILPGGIHTPPKDGGLLLPLIERWQSGGTCDCGGWDIGCKLRVLHSQKPSHNLTKTTKPHPNNTANIFQLFDQERERPTLTLVSHGNEFHSVEFDSSISHIQAFFISLTLINPQNSYLSWGSSNVSETEVFREQVVTGDDHIKRKMPGKYASNPPVSPVGRV